jgi:hypothetical protein
MLFFCELCSQAVNAEKFGMQFYVDKFRTKFYALLTVHLSISLDNDQLDAQLLILQYVHYNPLHVSSFTCSSSRGLNCIDAASGIVLPVSGRPVHRTATDWEDDTICCISTIQTS